MLIAITLHRASNPTSTASKGDSQRARLHYINHINHFLADQNQRPPVGCGPGQTENEAKDAGEARASANIHAFDVQYGSGQQSPGGKTTQELSSN